MEFKLTDVVNCLLKDRHNYKNIPVKVKEDNFFIINRFLSKRFPEKAQGFNKKNIDKSLALDLWFLFLRHQKNTDIQKWIWSKVPNSGDKKFTDNDVKLLMNKLDIRKDDIITLEMYYPGLLEEELKYFKSLTK